jgi:hypothetical protein
MTAEYSIGGKRLELLKQVVPSVTRVAVFRDPTQGSGTSEFAAIRAETKGNVDQQRTRRTQRRISVSQMLARIRQHIVAVDTRGGNRMRESCTYGSVRGVRGNSHPYRAKAPVSWRDMHRPGRQAVSFFGRSRRLVGAL